MNEQHETTWNEARDILDDARQWRHLTPAEWATLDKHLDALETAAAWSDAEAAISAITELELMSPLRCGRSKSGTGGIPAETLDFLNHVDALIKENLAECR